MRTLLIFLVLLFASSPFAEDKIQDGKPDPTENVMQLVEAAVKRLDDIQVLQTRTMSEMFQTQNKALNDRLDMFMQNSKDLAAAEKSRIDAIRSVDVSAAAIDRERATSQATALANQVTASAENLRALVSSTAVAEANRLTIILSDLTKRIADLERVQSLAMGSQTGVKDIWGLAFGVIMLLIAIAAFIVPKLKAEPGDNKKE